MPGGITSSVRRKFQGGSHFPASYCQPIIPLTARMWRRFVVAGSLGRELCGSAHPELLSRAHRADRQHTLRLSAPSVPELMDSQGKAALPGKGWRSMSSPTGTSRAQPSIPGTRRILSLGTAGGETGSQGHDSIGNTKGFGVSRWGTRPWVTAAPGVTPALSPRRH